MIQQTYQEQLCRPEFACETEVGSDGKLGIMLQRSATIVRKMIVNIGRGFQIFVASAEKQGHLRS